MDSFVRARLKDLARRRNAIFVGLKRNRPLGKDYEEVGLLGEWEFACFCGQMPKLMVGGDGGWDFEVPVVFTVDVKTARRADRLLVEAGKVKADIYVLAHFQGEAGEGEASPVQLVGWTSAHVVKSYEPYDTGRGIVNHCVPKDKLRPMDELRVMMGKISRP
jgi:hypothetical protein